MASLSVQPASLPERTVLDGRFVRIVPLDANLHADHLYQATHYQRRADLWRYLSAGPFASKIEFDDYLRNAEQQHDPLFFTIVEKTANAAVGMAAYLRITPAHRVMEVGHLLFGPALQKTAGATEAMYLMAKHAFEDLRYRRYEWKCHALNVASRSAALRLGFTFEGIFRQHMIVKGRNRDTAWFAMLDSEWPACKAALESWLHPSNFDGNGKQARPLASLRFNRQYGDCVR